MNTPTFEQQQHGIEFGDIFVWREIDEVDNIHEVIVMDTFRWDDPTVLARFDGTSETAWQDAIEFVGNLDPRMFR
jgi:hypothetical protein